MPEAVSTQTLISQVTSQRGKVQTTVGDFISAFIEKSQRVGTQEHEENLDPSFTKQMRSHYRQFTDESKFSRIISFTTEKMHNDNGRLYYQFATAWLNILRFVEDERERARFLMLKSLLGVLALPLLTERDGLHWYMYRACDLFVVEVEKCDEPTIRRLVDSVTDMLAVSDAPSPLWTRAMVALLGVSLKSLDPVAVSRTAMNWLAMTKTPEAFSSLLKIISDPSIDLQLAIEDFVSEVLSEEIAAEEKKSTMSWKAVCLLDYVDVKICNQVVRELLTSWPSDIASPSKDILPAIAQLKEKLSNNGDGNEALIAAFKREQELFLSSEFGFLAGLACSERIFGKESFVSEMKRVLGKLWKFLDEMEDNGWIHSTEFGHFIVVVKKQFENVLIRLDIGEVEQWDLFADNLMRLAYSLFQVPSTTQVVIVDGRVADGPSLWLFAQKIVRRIIFARPAALKTMLQPLLQWIARFGVSRTGASLILIDVLFDVVKTHNLKVMNNSELLRDFFSNVCDMGQAAALPFIRCLVPIINHRVQLREALFRGLQRNVYCPISAKCAVPLLLVLLRSVSQRVCIRANDGTGGSMSQSFASFSTQSLSMMGLKRANDETVSLKLIDILKNCLNMLAPTRSVLYQSIAETASRCTSLVIPSLDLLVGRVNKIPEWNVAGMIDSDENRTELVEAFPHYVQAIESLICDLVTIMHDEEHQTQSHRMNTVLFERVEAKLTAWVSKAASDDVHDLGIDKLADMNVANRTGRSNWLFSHMMLNLYDALLEHLWNRFYVYKSKEYTDNFIAVLKRRGELSEVLDEKNLRRKEAKANANDAPKVDVEQTTVFIRARTIRNILAHIVPPNADAGDFEDAKEELLSWALSRILDLSQDLLRSRHPLNSMISEANELVKVAGFLFDVYVGADCAAWMQEIDPDDHRKTKAIEAYSNIISYLCAKYKCTPEKIAAVWQKTDPTQSGTQRSGTNKILLQHVHTLMIKLYPALASITGDGVTTRSKKKTGAWAIDIERQAKALVKTSKAILIIIPNVKAYQYAHNFMLKMLKTHCFDNNAVLRDLLKFVNELGLKCADNEAAMKLMLELAEDVITVLSDEGDQPGYAFITVGTQPIVAEFLFANAEGQLKSIRGAVTVLKEVFPKDNSMDRLLCDIFTKCMQCVELIACLMRLHTQFHVHRERIAEMLTNLFTALQTPVDLLLAQRKNVPEMLEWKSIEKLSEILKGKLENLMAVADENIGLLNPTAEKFLNRKQSIAKSSKERRIYVKYVKARESFQCRVLLLSRALDKDELNFIIKNNAIGVRDFRIIIAKMKEEVPDEPAPRKKPRQQQQTTDETEEQEEMEVDNEEDEEMQDDDNDDSNDGPAAAPRPSIVY